jgi:autotransporter-associated beta strand protein
VFLRGGSLNVGSNDLSTTFSGVIQGNPGSLTKIGLGTLILSGANTYIGNTNVNRGVLQVDGSINSNTSVHGRGTLAGIGTIDGNVTTGNWGKISPGSGGAPGMLTVVHNYTQAQYATLMIQIAGTSPDQFSVLNVLGAANLNGFLDPVLLNGFVPTVGDQFTFLNYASSFGAFRLHDGGIFNNGTERWVVDYQPTNAILTATSFAPDQGSTFLLLTLGLLGLVMYRRQLLRGQS